MGHSCAYRRHECANSQRWTAWGRAGGEAYAAFMEARGAFAKIREEVEEIQMMREAAQSLMHDDPKKAANMLETELVPRLVEAGKLADVAKMHQQIAETVRDEDIDVSMDHYRKAADMFLSAGAKSDMVKCKLKLGEFAGTHENYDEAVAMFVEVRASIHPHKRVWCHHQPTTPPLASLLLSPLLPPKEGREGG